jgi:lipopolysaccharide export system permease protein
MRPVPLVDLIVSSKSNNRTDRGTQAPRMKLIERYIFQRAGIAVLVTLSSLVGVVWIIQALKELDVFTTKGQTVVSPA